MHDTWCMLQMIFSYFDFRSVTAVTRWQRDIRRSLVSEKTEARSLSATAVLWTGSNWCKYLWHCCLCFWNSGLGFGYWLIFLTLWSVFLTLCPVFLTVFRVRFSATVVLCFWYWFLGFFYYMVSYISIHHIPSYDLMKIPVISNKIWNY